MSDITIVTAFFDIGRGDWTPDKGYPHYLQRSTDTYFERFAHMAKLENKIIVYTEGKFKDRVLELRGDRPTEVVVIDNLNGPWLDKIKIIHESERFKNIINPSVIKNPEYWNAEYVLVNWMKSYFVNFSYFNGFIDTEMCAWLDFGYCRSEDTLNGITKWKYDFDQSKIHVWTIKDIPTVDSFGDVFFDAIINNTVYITGPAIVANSVNWAIFQETFTISADLMLKLDMVDDDQGIMLFTYTTIPDKFELHRLKDDWFVVFKEYAE